MLYSVFAFQAIVCFTFAFLSIVWQDKNGSDHTYLDLSGDPDGGVYMIYVMTFLVAISHLIPISLYVALEVVKLS
jgi:magnesium-transporting ATPase (P-type)